MVTKEEKAEGGITMAMYYLYFRAGGSIIFLTFATFVFVSLEVRAVV